MDREDEGGGRGRERVQGIVLSTIYHQEEDGFRVIQLEPDGGGRKVTATGVFGDLENGEHVVLEGRWTEHPRFGAQFKAESFAVRPPETAEGLVRYLGGGALPGVGEVTARRIVERFGADTLAMLDKDPLALAKIKGLGRKRAERIAGAWRQRAAHREAMLFLASHGVGLALAGRVCRAWGEGTMAALRADPYRLVREVPGVGFLTADRLAMRLGLAPDSPARLRAGLAHGLLCALEDGHCLLPRPELVSAVAGQLGQPGPRVEEALRELAAEGLVEDRDGLVQDAYLARLERDVAREVLRRARNPSVQRADGPAAASLGGGMELDAEQLAALRTVLSRGLAVLTGGPGVGKTTLVRALVATLERRGVAPVLCAPTGRAAQRLQEATGRAASTIHRLLKPRAGGEGGFLFGPDRPLEGQVFVVDEFSMVDLPLFHALLFALPRYGQLVLVGDKDQLPSVGPGRVLGDLLASGAVTSCHLKRVYRQGPGSLLVGNSHRLLARQMPEEPPPGVLGDFYFAEAAGPEAVLRMLDRLLLERIPARFGAAAASGAQVLSPMKKGPLGTAALNARLQDLLNPAGARLSAGGGQYRLGDRVIQLANDYDLDLYNGDLGRILGEEAGGLAVEFSGRRLMIPADRLHSVALAYACTVHKSQGSEYPVVLMPLARGHRHMLSIELLYTAMTRAKRLCVWIGEREFLRGVLERPPTESRHTRLAGLLRGAPGSAPAGLETDGAAHQCPRLM